MLIEKQRFLKTFPFVNSVLAQAVDALHDQQITRWEPREYLKDEFGCVECQVADARVKHCQIGCIAIGKSQYSLAVLIDTSSVTIVFLIAIATKVSFSVVNHNEKGQAHCLASRTLVFMCQVMCARL